MNQREELIETLQRSRERMVFQLDKIDLNRKIYPLWTIREMLAHLSGWDDAVIAFIQSLMAGAIPATPASRGMDAYNSETVATREGLDYDHVYREYVETRKTVLKLLLEVSEQQLTQEYILPWGEPGTLVDIINIFGPHEEEHAEDVAKIIAQSK